MIDSLLMRGKSSIKNYVGNVITLIIKTVRYSACDYYANGSIIQRSVRNKTTFSLKVFDEKDQECTIKHQHERLSKNVNKLVEIAWYTERKLW